MKISMIIAVTYTTQAAVKFIGVILFLGTENIYTCRGHHIQ